LTLDGSIPVSTVSPRFNGPFSSDEKSKPFGREVGHTRIGCILRFWSKFIVKELDINESNESYLFVTWRQDADAKI
jgi:hypothetical protein